MYEGSFRRWKAAEIVFVPIESMNEKKQKKSGLSEVNLSSLLASA